MIVSEMKKVMSNLSCEMNVSKHKLLFMYKYLSSYNFLDMITHKFHHIMLTYFFSCKQSSKKRMSCKIIKYCIYVVIFESCNMFMYLFVHVSLFTFYKNIT